MTLPPYDQELTVESDSDTPYNYFYGLLWLLLAALCFGFVAGSVLSAVAILIWILGSG